MTAAEDNPAADPAPESDPPLDAKTTAKLCPQCGVAVPDGTPSVLCPKCLLKLGFESQPGLDQPSTAAYRPRFVAPLPEQLAPYFPQLEILERVGYGGMGVVYKARQKELDRLIALKILRPDFESDSGFAERFQREARALAKLSHPHIVAVYDFGKQGDLYFFLMEFVDGTNLRQVEQSGRLSPKEALGIVPQVCDALQYAHEQGVVHRDIKPENILISKEGRVKIADFGLAKLARPDDANVSDAERLTGTREVVGTPHYMAPEQVERPADVDHRADIFSLGVVLYEMLTGELPLGRFPLPSQKVQLDLRLDEVVLRSLEKEPAQRYQRVSEVRTDVDHIRASESLPPEAAKEAAAKSSARAAWVKVKLAGVAAFVASLFTPTKSGEPKTREQLQQELEIPSIAITVIGAASLLTGLVMFLRVMIGPWLGDKFVFLALTTLATGAAAIFTGLPVRNLQNYSHVIVGLVMLFLIPGLYWVASLPFAIWTLVILRHPDSKGHFINVPLSDSRAWLMLRDSAANMWQWFREFVQFVWPKLRQAGTNVAELAPNTFTKVVEVSQRKDLTCGAIFLALESVWSLWCCGVFLAILISLRVLPRTGQYAPEIGPSVVLSGASIVFAWVLGTMVLLRHSGRLLRAKGSLTRSERLAAPTEALLGMLFTSFAAAIAVVFIGISNPFPNYRFFESLQDAFHQMRLVLVLQFDFYLFIGLSLALMHYSSRTRLTRWALFFSTILLPMGLSSLLFAGDPKIQWNWTPFAAIWLCVPPGIWAVIVLQAKPAAATTAEPIANIAEEVAAKN